MFPTITATDVRKNFSRVIDCAIRERPQFITRTRDQVCLADNLTMLRILEAYHYTAAEYKEDDGSVTLSLKELDLAENAPTKKEALLKLAGAILEYANEYYREYALYSSVPNRKGHVPYVLKAAFLGTPEMIEKEILCRAGKN